jgi:hypothetical protein
MARICEGEWTMTVNERDADILRMYGFTIREIAEYNNAKMPNGELQPPIDLSSPVWQEALLARQELVGKISDQYRKDFNKRLTRARLDNIINGYYATGKTSPWDFIKSLYVPKLVVDFTTTSIEKARKEAKRKIKNWKQRVKRLI